MKVTINVTQEDIDKGKQGDSCKCPVALALRRIHPGARVGSLTLFIADDWVESTPEVARKFISEFDNGRPVGPISFDILGITW